MIVISLHEIMRQGREAGTVMHISLFIMGKITRVILMPEPRSYPDFQNAQAEWESVIGLIDETVLRGKRWFRGEPRVRSSSEPSNMPSCRGLTRRSWPV